MTGVLTEAAIEVRAHVLLRQMFGARAVFREGQMEAIRAIVQHGRLLLVQRTGWGKSVVYFVATKILRQYNFGPTLLISPLLSLMRNQQEMADRLGLRAATINSANAGEWKGVEQEVAGGSVDVLLVSPERLANQGFTSRILPSIVHGIGLFVVDEAHCISDWGHDFRPDYRRIVRIVRSLPRNIPLLATTATANDRVVDDVRQQLGPTLVMMRGTLARDSLRLQTVELPSQAERLAWLAEQVPHLRGSGVIYCLTVADTEKVAGWLRGRGLDVQSYHAGLPPERRVALEQALLANTVKALAATVALGMGFDKPDLGFVVHYQRPASPVAYYQQIGRAGRALDDAPAVLLYGGTEDDRIAQVFRNSAFPAVAEARAVLGALEHAERLKARDIMAQVDVAYGHLERILKILEVDGAVLHEGTWYVRTPNAWRPDEERWRRVTEQRLREAARMQEFATSRECLMQFLQRELDDPSAARCGRCANCAGEFITPTCAPALVAQAREFLSDEVRAIEPRQNWPAGAAGPHRGRITEHFRAAEGRTLCTYGHEGLGELVRRGKYVDQRFDQELVRAAVRLIEERWRPDPAPAWVTAIPSLRREFLVAEFAARLAAALKLPFRAALEKCHETPEQKTQQNSAHQVPALLSSLRACPRQVLAGPVLLIDDMVDSRWTMTIAAMRLREAGSGPVYPLALAATWGADKS